MSPIRLAYIGLGTVADYHLQAVAELPHDFSVIAGADLDEAQAAKLPPSASFYRDYREMILHQSLDAVVIALPNSLHFPVAKACLGKVQYVLIEKPAVLSRKEWEELEQMSSKHGTHIYTGFHARFARDVLWWEVQRTTHPMTRQLGNPIGFCATFYDPYVQAGKLAPKARSLSGSWMDSGPNALSVAFALFPRIRYRNHQLDIQQAIHDRDLAAEYEFSVENSEGRKGTGRIQTNWQLDKNYKATELFFSDDRISVLLDHSAQSVILLQEGERHVLADLSETGPRMLNHYQGVYADFRQAVRTRTDNFAFSRKVHYALFSHY